MQGSAQKQIEEEWEHFQTVRHACGLPPDRGLYQFGRSEKLREPDIIFNGGDGQQGFELTEFCDTNLQKLTAKARFKRSSEGFSFKREIGTVPRILGRKFEARKYTDRFPIDLICYWNARALISDKEAVRQIAAFLGAQENRPFRKIWFVGLPGLYEFAPDGSVIKNYGHDLDQLMGQPVLHLY